MMDIRKIAIDTINANGGVAKTADFNATGLTNQDLSRLCNEGFLDRVRRGLYSLSEKNNVSEAKLIATTIPEAIVCVESALFYYGYSDKTPLVWSIAVPRRISRSKTQNAAVFIRPYYIQDDLYEIGKTEADFEGIILPIYDRERTICDCFKYKTKLDNEMFVKAVNAYVADEKKNLGNLSKYAKELKLYKKVTELMEVLLNG